MVIVQRPALEACFQVARHAWGWPVHQGLDPTLLEPVVDQSRLGFLGAQALVQPVVAEALAQCQGVADGAIVGE